MVNFSVAKNENQKEVTSYLGPNTHLEGECHASGDLHIDGRFKGEIICNGTVILGQTSQVSGIIKAEKIYVSGRFSGSLDVTNLIQVSQTGYVDGDIKGAQLVIQEGGIYKGKVNMDVVQTDSIYEGTFQVIKR